MPARSAAVAWPRATGIDGCEDKFRDFHAELLLRLEWRQRLAGLRSAAAAAKTLPQSLAAAADFPSLRAAAAAENSDDDDDMLEAREGEEEEEANTRSCTAKVVAA